MKAFTVTIVILAIAGIGVYSYLMGVYDVKRDILPEIYGQYNHLTMYEDGSYVGETMQGVGFSGCIKGALCDE